MGHTSVKNYFTIKELCHSNTAVQCGLRNFPGDEELENIMYITRPHMNAIREFVGVPWIVNSGYRDSEVNKRVKGSPRSYHMKGLAVDGYPKGLDLRETFEKIKAANFPFIDQCIIYPKQGFIHIGFAPEGQTPRNMYFEK